MDSTQIKFHIRYKDKPVYSYMLLNYSVFRDVLDHAIRLFVMGMASMKKITKITDMHRSGKEHTSEASHINWILIEYIRKFNLIYHGENNVFKKYNPCSDGKFRDTIIRKMETNSLNSFISIKYLKYYFKSTPDIECWHPQNFIYNSWNAPYITMRPFIFTSNHSNVVYTVHCLFCCKLKKRRCFNKKKYIMLRFSQYLQLAIRRRKKQIQCHRQDIFLRLINSATFLFMPKNLMKMALYFV
jgi:hypothetical protein